MSTAVRPCKPPAMSTAEFLLVHQYGRHLLLHHPCFCAPFFCPYSSVVCYATFSACGKARGTPKGCMSTDGYLARKPKINVDVLHGMKLVYQGCGLRGFVRGLQPTLARAFLMDAVAFYGYSSTLHLLD
eukprot:387712-Pelagomonas_calceolata.AAC.5